MGFKIFRSTESFDVRSVSELRSQVPMYRCPTSPGSHVATVVSEFGILMGLKKMRATWYGALNSAFVTEEHASPPCKLPVLSWAVGWTWIG